MDLKKVPRVGEVVGVERRSTFGSKTHENFMINFEGFWHEHNIPKNHIYQGKKHQVKDNKSKTTEEKNPSQLKRNPPKKQRTILCIYYYNNIICSHYKPWMYYILPKNESSVQDCKKYMKKIHWLKKISQDSCFIL